MTTVQAPANPLGVPFAAALARFGAQPALIGADRVVSYAELAHQVAATTIELGAARRLVHVPITPDVPSVAGYLACLAGGHPVLLTSPDSPVASTYEPDVTLTGGSIRAHRDEAAHELHPELGLLLSTSGSTGSPKLVRLSADNVQANAESIARALGIRPDDRAVTSLPLHYCYGLSVLHSHLLVGAAVVLTRLSVTEPCFWELCAEHRVTTLAGVPHTFALLERTGFVDRDLPALRCVTQAGGRMAPDEVRNWAAIGRRRGWDLHVMYGQTEATARMAVLAPDLALSRPEAIGRAVPGGSFRLAPCAEATEAGSGELVYRGPNVMLGYAHGPADLALGRKIDELHTGDLARIGRDGLVEIVGRRSRFLKPFGIRVDLDHLEAGLRAEGHDVAVTGDDGGLHIAAVGSSDLELLRALAAGCTSLPVAAVRACRVDKLPRTESGKIDTDALRRLVTTAPATAASPASVAAVFALVLGLPGDDVHPDSTFAGLGGDSLSYVEAGVRLEKLLPALPRDWHLLPVAALDPPPGASTPYGSRRPTAETSVVLRALGILLVVAHHSHLFKVLGGAHLLLAVAGFNLARFHLTPTSRGDRARRLLRSTRRIAVASVAAVAVSELVLGWYDVSHLLLVHDLLSARGIRHFWFVEVLLQLLLLTGCLLAIPAIHRVERRFPFALPFVLLTVGLLLRFDVLPAPPADRLYAPYALAWLFAWGWAAAQARHPGQRALLVATLAIGMIDFFPGQPGRGWLVGSGLLLLLTAQRLPTPRWMSRTASWVATGSLHTYLISFLVLAAVPGPPVLGFVACLLGGRAFYELHRHLERARPRRAEAAARATA